MYGYGGDDEFRVRPGDRAYGGAGDDIFDLSGSSDVKGGYADGGDGIDTLDLSFGWIVDLREETASWISDSPARTYEVSSMENVSVYAWRGYETLVEGTDTANLFSVDPNFNDGSVGVVFDGRGGNDVLNASAGNDTLMGNEGYDWIIPGRGNDTVDGGVGRDMVSYSDAPEVAGRGTNFMLDLDLGAGTAELFGGETDQLISIERATGSIFADVMRGSDGNDEMRGLGDYDWFIATAGNDTLDGGNGQDMITFLEAASS
ncbi:hypothetical protein J7426_23650, partial [Tropicibacter sp. R16_0]|nr:hypothetical protein [Tropicibacter sp. R16_0]